MTAIPSLQFGKRFVNKLNLHPCILIDFIDISKDILDICLKPVNPLFENHHFVGLRQ